MIDSINQLRILINSSSKFKFPIFIVLSKKDLFDQYYNADQFKKCFPNFTPKNEFTKYTDSEIAFNYLLHFFNHFDERIKKVYHFNLIKIDEFKLFIEDYEKETIIKKE